jgi:hypothetical protein
VLGLDCLNAKWGVVVMGADPDSRENLEGQQPCQLEEIRGSLVIGTVTMTRTRSVAPPACLETPRRGDKRMDILRRNVRDRRLSLALKACILASQACRKEAPP